MNKRKQAMFSAGRTGAIGIGLFTPWLVFAAAPIVATPGSVGNLETGMSRDVQWTDKQLVGLSDCLSVQSNGVASWCVKEIQLYRQKGKVTARFRVDVSRDGQLAYNEYMIWNDCGTAVYRLLSREPIHLPAKERLRTVEANGSAQAHQVLRSLGSLGCTVNALAR